VVVAAEDRQQHLHDHECQAEGQQRLVHVTAVHQRPCRQHQSRAHRRAEQDGHQYREAEARPGRAGLPGDPVAGEGTDQEEGAVRQVQHVEQPEHDRQADGHHEQQQARDHTVQQHSRLGRQPAHHESTCRGSRP
jgi:hypothetical protein